MRLCTIPRLAGVYRVFPETGSTDMEEMTAWIMAPCIEVVISITNWFPIWSAVGAFFAVPFAAALIAFTTFARLSAFSPSALAWPLSQSHLLATCERQHRHRRPKTS